MNNFGKNMISRRVSIYSSVFPANQARGFTLLEVLVALVILGLSFLGVGRLMMGSVKASDSAYMRTQATMMATAVLDNMRANRAAAIAGAYNVNFGTSGYSASTNCYQILNTGASYDANQIAVCDIAQWEYQLQKGGILPEGDGQISVVSTTNGAQATISVRWEDNRAASAFNPTKANISSIKQQIQLMTVL